MKTALCRFFCLTVALLALTAAAASAETYLFDRTIGGTDLDNSTSIALDGDGNFYVAGSFSGTVDFGGGDRTAAGGDDIFIVKFDRDGNYVWDYTAGGVSDNDVAYNVQIDSEGNVVACGSFQESVDFGGGARTSVGNQDIFVLKLDADGGWIWDRTFGNTNEQAAVALAVDGADNVIFTGRFRNPINFGGGVRRPAGMRDGFLVKLDTDGAYLWDRAIGGEGRDSGRKIAVDADDNIYVVGNFEYTVDFGGGARTEGNTPAYDGYLLKLDADGNYLADDTWGGAGEDAPWSVATCPDGGVIVTGYFEQTVNFGGGDRFSVGSGDICAVKFDGDCNYLWDETWGGAGSDFGIDVAVLSDDHIFITGAFERRVDFGGGQRISAGAADVFVLEIGSGGHYLWDDTFGGTDRERAEELVVDVAEGMYVTGSFVETVDFGGGDRTSNGSRDAFVVKYDVPVPATVDIDPNTLNLKSAGRWITCYIELFEGYDVSDIDVATVLLGGVVPAEADPTCIGDYDDDGRPDIMVKFDRSEVIALLAPGEKVYLSVTGLVGGEDFEGSDCIKVIGPPLYPPEDEEIEAPAGALSLRAHPNPFNPAVRILYDVPASGRVLVRVYDISGRLVRTLEDVEKTAGSYQIEWNGKNDAGATVSSGVYFCRLSVGGGVVTHKLMLLR